MADITGTFIGGPNDGCEFACSGVEEGAIVRNTLQLVDGIWKIGLFKLVGNKLVFTGEYEFEKAKPVKHIRAEEVQSDRDKIDLGRCPCCNGHIASQRDPHQYGHRPKTRGDWYHILCGQCGYQADWILERK